MKNFTKLLSFVFVLTFSLFSCKPNLGESEINEPDDLCENVTLDEPLDYNDLKGTVGYSSDSSNIKEWCNSLFFYTKKIGYATTQSGEIFKTTDGGERWKLLGEISTVSLNTIFFVNSCVGYASGGKSNCSPSPCTPYGSVVYKTIDGGKSWIKQSVPYAWSELNSTWFFTEKIGLVVGLGLSIKTSDGGNTWQAFTAGNKNNMRKISFVSSNVGHCLSLTGNLFRTEDMGITWKNVIVSDDYHTSDFCFTSENIGYANNLKNLMKTTDGGYTWDLIYTANESIEYIYFITENIGIILGYENGGIGDFDYYNIKIQITKDGGKTWSDQILDQWDFNSNCLFAKDNIIYSLSYDKIRKLIIK
jgi:photosystem II stability/assembly factor-like uncharacterized protein